mmetsp:Transcript_25322/g.45645  ORF Transcript_25322/g.45645 Transcript_25322/m.45645 type:complete len:435 (+) Transcript_25322:31-1335(+)
MSTLRRRITGIPFRSRGCKNCKGEKSSRKSARKHTKIMTTTFTEASWSDRSVFLFFMLLWIVYGLLNQLNSINDIRFDPAAVVWSQEVLKIIISIGLFFVQDGSPRVLFKEAREHWTLIFWYSIPAGLYALGDVLTYINLRSFDPATLHLLGEMKLVSTAVVHQMLFKRKLSRLHWVALGVITLGCIIKAVDSMELSTAVPMAGDGDGGDDNSGDLKEPPKLPHPTAFNYFLILVHILISTVAGVYNEKLLKDKPMISINLQNICLYLDGMTFLMIGIAGGLSEHSSISEALSPSSLRALFAEPSILAMACTMSIAGIVTSRFLKVFDSIRKSVAVALVVVSLPFLSRLFFGTGISVRMVASILLVVLGMGIYTSQPPPKTMDITRDEVCQKEEDEAELFLPAISLPSGVVVGDEEIEDGSRSTAEEIELAFSI